jgi:hypothetical protein
VRFAVARSRRSALLCPRMRAAGGLDRAIREPRVSNCRRPHVNLLTTRGDGGIFEFSSTVAIRNPFTSPDVKHTNRRPQVTIRFFLDSFPGRRPARRHVRGTSDWNGLGFGLRSMHRHVVEIATLSRPQACHASMHRSRTQCCPSTAERARETGIDVQDGQAYHGRTTTGSARAAATTSTARSHEREQPDRCAV